MATLLEPGTGRYEWRDCAAAGALRSYLCLTQTKELYRNERRTFCVSLRHELIRDIRFIRCSNILLLTCSAVQGKHLIRSQSQFLPVPFGRLKFCPCFKWRAAAKSVVGQRKGRRRRARGSLLRRGAHRTKHRPAIRARGPRRTAKLEQLPIPLRNQHLFHRQQPAEGARPMS